MSDVQTVSFFTKVKILFGICVLVGAGTAAWKTFGPGFTTQTPTDQDQRIVQMLVEVSDVDGKAASANVVAHTVSNLTGRMTWQDGPVSKTWSETLTIGPHESLEVYLVASPVTPRGKRRAVTCYLKVSDKNVPGTPVTTISYPTDSSKECAINFLIPPLVK